MHWLSVAATLALVALEVRGFGGGAPQGACMDLLPRHQGMKRNGAPSPYTITVTPAVAPGEDAQVEISGTAFKGYMLQAVQGNRIVGFFKGTGLVTCENRDDTATHQGGGDKRTETFTWTAPRALTGDVYIRGTVLERYDNAYVNVYSNKITVK